jgi:hypothetical protein
MSRAVRSLLLLVLLGSLSTGIDALELTKGRLKLVLHEGTGRFSLYYMTDIREQTYEPLFLVQDPRTSSLTILEGNRAFRMGDSNQFTEEITETTNGARFTFDSPALEVVQEFQFITSVSASLADAVVVRLSITNNSEQALSVGARYIFDTVLGERENVHFRTPSVDAYTREAELTPSETLWYWRSPSPENEGFGFQQTVFGSGVTPPSRIVFANWKRLNESNWEYEVESRRNFNLLPYSINDSAAAIYYDAEILDRGGTRRIIAVFGNQSDGSYVLESNGDTGISRVFQQVVTPESPAATESAVRADLIAVEDLIEQIDALLANPSQITAEDVEVLREVIAELEERRAVYE